MLTTTRREIINDYDISQNRQLRNFAPDYEAEQQEKTQKSFGRTEDFRTADSYLSRSEIAQKLYGQNYREEYEQFENSAKDYSDPNLMPSRETMQITRPAYYGNEERTAAKSATKQKYSTKSKILIASYAAVLLALALIITLTTVSVASLFSDVSRLEVELNSQIETVASLDESIEAAGSAETVLDKAAQMGMSGATVDSTFDLPATKAAQNVSVNTNWFDGLCNWFSNIFGG